MKLTAESFPALGHYGYDAIVKNDAAGEVIGDGWGATREEAASQAIDDARFTLYDEARKQQEAA